MSDFIERIAAKIGRSCQIDEAAARGGILPARQAAQLLGCSRRTLTRAEIRGELTALRVSKRRIYFATADLAVWYAKKSGGLSTTAGKRSGGRPWGT